MYIHKNGVSWRKIEENDLSFLLNIKNESWWGVHSSAILNTDDQDRWYRSLSNTTVCMIAELNNNKVGFLLINNIDWIGRMASIGGAVHESSRNSQVSLHVFQSGTDFAFEFLNLHRLNAEVLETNYSVQKIDIGALGFSVEGVKRKSVYKCGRYYDSIVLGLLRSDWEKQERIQGYNGSCNKIWNHDDAESKARRSKKWRNTQSTYPDVLLQSSMAVETIVK